MEITIFMHAMIYEKKAEKSISLNLCFQEIKGQISMHMNMITLVFEL